MNMGIELDMEAAMNTIFGIARTEYSSFITRLDMIYAENASDEEDEELEASNADDPKYHSFGKTRGIDF